MQIYALSSWGRVKDQEIFLCHPTGKREQEANVAEVVESARKNQDA